MRFWIRILLLGTFALILNGLAPRSAHAQYNYNPYYSFFWHNYWYNYGSAMYPGARYWGYYPWYSYNYPPGYVYYVPYYVAVPEPYPVPSPSPAPVTKSSEKAARKPALTERESKVPPPPKPALSPEEAKKQEERDAARQLRLAKILLEAADEEQRTGKEEDAQRLRQIAHGHFANIALRYSSTPSGEEARQLLAKEETP
jgi:hypothetical protein